MPRNYSIQNVEYGLGLQEIPECFGDPGLTKNFSKNYAIRSKAKKITPVIVTYKNGKEFVKEFISMAMDPKSDIPADRYYYSKVILMEGQKAGMFSKHARSVGKIKEITKAVEIPISQQEQQELLKIDPEKLYEMFCCWPPIERFDHQVIMQDGKIIQVSFDNARCSDGLLKAFKEFVR